MIKVNYDSKTKRVISFGKDTQPYIEITEKERKQPLPDRYSYYAVEDGKFVIKRRTPTAEEISVDKKQAINQEIALLKANLFKTDYKAIKFSEGLLTANEYAETKAQREAWRKRINELEEQL